MEASIVELRTKMREITHAIFRGETVTILSHGKAIGTLQPITPPKSSSKKVKDHPFFNLQAGEDLPAVSEVMAELRKGRYAL